LDFLDFIVNFTKRFQSSEIIRTNREIPHDSVMHFLLMTRSTAGVARNLKQRF